MSDSDSETAPLNPAAGTEEGAELDSNNDTDSFFQFPTRKRKDFLHIFILYGLSCGLSVAGLICAGCGYGITIFGPLDKNSRQRHRDGYETNFVNIQSVIILLGVNILYTAFNLHLARLGLQQNFFVVNFIYDFLLWAALIGFGVLNMVLMLVDQRVCDGWEDKDMYEKCDIWMFRLLVVEMVTVNLGLLVAVIHFIILIARCCTHRDMLLDIRERIAEEEGMLIVLVERRQRLLEETRALQAGLPLPSVPVVTGGSDPDAAKGSEQLPQSQENTQQVDEDLIDMVRDEPEREVDSSEFTPFASATG